MHANKRIFSERSHRLPISSSWSLRPAVQVRADSDSHRQTVPGYALSIFVDLPALASPARSGSTDFGYDALTMGVGDVTACLAWASGLIYPPFSPEHLMESWWLTCPVGECIIRWHGTE